MVPEFAFQKRDIIFDQQVQFPLQGLWYLAGRAQNRHAVGDGGGPFKKQVDQAGLFLFYPSGGRGDIASAIPRDSAADPKIRFRLYFALQRCRSSEIGRFRREIKYKEYPIVP
jgi:hypothetical protein